MREQNFHQDPEPNASSKIDSRVGAEAGGSPLESLHAEEALDASMDPALDRLLARVKTPELRPGFAERVIHSVQPASILPWSQARKSSPLWALGLAAALALCTGSLLWTTTWTNTSQETRHSARQHGASPEEEHLIAALRSPELSGDDLALVANLREVLEAELIANHPLWLDEK